MGPYAICGTRRPRSACAFAQADLGLRFQLIYIYINGHCRRCRQTENTKIRLHGCACWSGPSLFVYDRRAFLLSYDTWAQPVIRVIRQDFADRCPIVHLRQMAMQRVSTELDYTVRECAGWSKIKMKMSICGLMHWTQAYLVPVSLFVLRFYGPVNPMGSCRARSVYLTTRLLGRLSPLSG